MIPMRRVSAGSSSAGALLVLAVLCSGLALADEPDARTRAFALAEDAAVKRSRGELEGAIVLMKEAIALHPDPGLVYNLGRLYEDSEVLDLAQLHYNRALAADTSDAVKERARKGLERIEEARRFGRIRFEGLPPDSRVEVDGAAPVPVTDLPLRLPSGARRLVVTSPGHEPLTVVVEVPGGRLLTQRLTLTTADSARSPTTLGTDPALTARADAGSTLPIWGWTAIGTGVAMAITGGVLVGVGQAEWDEVTGAEGWGTAEVTGISRSDADAAIASGESKQTAGWALMGVGVAALGTGIALLFLERDPDAAYQLLPGIAPHGDGLSCTLGATF